MSERDLFIAALKITEPAERTAWLDRECGGDAALRQRIDVLPRAFEKAGSLLENPAVAVARTMDEPITEAAGAVIGPYKLLELIGEGGMGAVWMAQQTEPVKRVVALKLIKAGMDSKQVIARFEAERQALALMDHPNIAKVLDGGTTDRRPHAPREESPHAEREVYVGRPYFVMDLVKGVPITRYCDEHHLTPRQRLELFIPVCQAVQHAHQKGIIHRDLKPSNVLVAHPPDPPLAKGGPGGVPKVIDFGVAKAAGQPLTEKTLVTGFGNIVGTLEYMSPEQAEINQLDIDTRSDIYSLGVLLYELLTGTTPLERKRLRESGILEALRIIREEDAPTLSNRLATTEALPAIAANRGLEPAKLTKLLRGELDWIVMKALEKDRSRRYETSNGFAMDVQRYLHDEAVLACPPSARYRLWKFARRNRRILATASLLILALVLGTAVSMWQAIRATQAEGLAEQRLGTANANYETAEEQRQRAEASERQAKTNEGLAKDAQKQSAESLKDAVAAVDQMLTRVGQDRLLFVPQMEPVRLQLMQEALKFYQKFLQKNSDDPVIRRDTAMVYRRLADIHRELGQYAEAETSYRKAFALFAELEVQAPLEPSTRGDVSLAHLELANCLNQLGKREEHDKNIRRAVEIAEDLVKEYPKDPNYRDHLVNATYQLLATTRPEEAEKMLRRNLTLTNTPHLLAIMHRRLAYLLASKGGSAEAEQAVRQALELFEKLASEQPSANWAQHFLGTTLHHLANSVAANGRLQEAEPIWGRATTILDKLATDYPAGPKYRHSQAWAHHERAALLKKLNRPAEAELAYRRALDLFVKLAADFPTMNAYPQTAIDQRLNLGRFLAEAGRAEDALDVYRHAVDDLGKLAADAPTKLNHWQGLVRTHIELGRLLAKAGKDQEAQAAYRDALAIRDRLEKEFAGKAEFRRELALSHLHTGHALRENLLQGGARWGAPRNDEVIKSYRMALGHAQQLVNAEPRARASRALLANIQLLLGSRLGWEAGQIDESEMATRKALADYEELAAEFPKRFEFALNAAECVFELALVEFRREQFPKAENLCRRAIARSRQHLEWPEHLRTAHEYACAEYRYGASHLYLARTLAHLGRPTEAEESFELATSSVKKACQNPNLRYLLTIFDCHTWFGLFLAESGRLDEAEQQFRRVLELSDPSDPYSRNKVAWSLVAHPNPRVHKGCASLAVKWAKEAVDRAPNDGQIVNTLGAAYYRAGDWKACIAALEKSMKLRKGGDSFEWFFLAMAHWQLGENDKAREWYDRAVQWMDKRQPKNEELRRFRAEAVELLELMEKK